MFPFERLKSCRVGVCGGGGCKMRSLKEDLRAQGAKDTWGCSPHVPVGRLCLHALMRFRCERPGIIPVLESGAPSGDKVPAPRERDCSL